MKFIASFAIRALIVEKNKIKRTAYTQVRPVRSVRFGYSQDNANQ